MRVAVPTADATLLHVFHCARFVMQYTNEANRNDIHFFVENKMIADTLAALDGRILAPNGSKMKIMVRVCFKCMLARIPY